MPLFNAQIMQLAMEHFQYGRHHEAETICRQVLDENPECCEALHLLGVLSLQADRYDDALVQLEKAVNANTCDPYAYNNLGAVLVKLDRLVEAETVYRAALKIMPDFVGAYLNLGHVLLRCKRSEEAIATYRKALLLDATNIEISFKLGNLLQDQGRLIEAQDVFRQIVFVEPNNFHAMNNLGLIQHQLARFSDARKSYEAALELNPQFAEAWLNLSNMEKELGRFKDAENACLQAISINPEFAEAYCNLGNILIILGKFAEAETACRKALELDPASSVAFINLGNAFQERGCFNESISAYRAAINLNPASEIAFGNYGNVLYTLGRTSAAKTAYQMALNLKPEYHSCRIKQVMLSIPIVANNTKQAKMVTIRFSRELEKFNSIMKLFDWGGIGEIVGAAHPFYLAYRTGNHKPLLSMFGDIVSKARSSWAYSRGYIVGDFKLTGRDRIRLVIVSGQIRRHSVWDVLLHGILRHMDRSRFEVIIYHTGTVQDSETSLACNLADHFVQGPADWMSHMTSDKPDIIFYPEIGMDQETIKLATLRLAPLQVASWGHPVTTGLPTIDIFYSGEHLERTDADEDYREKLVRLPGTGACSVLMQFNVKSPEIVLKKLPNDRRVIRYLVCQQASKFDPVYDTLYPRIALHSGPCCFLIVRDAKFPWASKLVEKRIRNAFKNAGMQPERYLLFTDWLPGDEFWGLMDAMDLYLDTPAFSGFTTAWQALQRGLPVVTLEGRFMRQRLAAGLMRKIGILETIANNIDEYVNIALSLARQPNKRLKLRNKILETAPRANEDIEVVRVFEQSLLKEYVSRI